MRYKNVGTSFFGFVTMHAYDRQTDRRTDRQTDGRTDRKGLKIPYVALHAVAQ